MDIKEKILEIRTVRNKTEFVEYFEKYPKEFEKLMNCIFNLEEYPYKEYASWILLHISKSGKIQFNQYYPKLVDVLFETDNQSVLRNITCTISKIQITHHRESEFIDLLISFIKDGNNKVALQVYSIYVLIRFVKRYPELKEEIAEIIALHRPGKTVAYKIAERNFLKKVAKY